MNIDPRHLTFVDWADSMTPSLIRFGNIPKVMISREWKDWALTVIQLPGISSQTPPNPVQFDDWREWAMRFNQAVS